MAKTEHVRFWRDRDITDRLNRERHWRKPDGKDSIGFKFEEGRTGASPR